MFNFLIHIIIVTQVDTLIVLFSQTKHNSVKFIKRAAPTVWQLPDKRQMMSLPENDVTSEMFNVPEFIQSNAFDIKRRDSNKMLFFSIFQKGQE